MASFEYLADGHHVDDAGNLIACTFVDFRDPAERLSITALRKASSKRHAIPGCETIRISEARLFPRPGRRDRRRRRRAPRREGLDLLRIDRAGDGRGAGRVALVDAGRPRRGLAHPPAAGVLAGVRARWSSSRPARAGGSSCCETRSRAGRSPRPTRARRSTTVPSPTSTTPYRRLESASSELEFALLLVFLMETAHRAQREYRFAVWAEDEPAEDTLDLGVSAALVDAMGKPRPEPEGSGFVPGPAEYLSRARVETLPAFVGAGAAATRRGDAARRSARDGGRRMRRSRRYAKPSTRRTRAAGRTWQLRRGTPSRGCGSSPRRWVAGSPTCG